MARGWDSKSVEDQIASTAERRVTANKPPLSASEREARARKTGLLLSRSKILSDLQKAGDERHRAMLQRSLDYIDMLIAGIDG